MPRLLPRYATPSETTAGNSISEPSPRLQTTRNGGRTRIVGWVCVRASVAPYIGHWERGRYLWRVHTGAYVYSSPAVWDGRVYFGSYNGRLYSVSARTGSLHWSVETGGPVSGSPVVVDGVAYAGSFSHRIVGVDGRSGRVVLRFPHGEYVPVSGSGGRLLLHGYSWVYAVEPLRARSQRPVRLTAGRAARAAGTAPGRTVSAVR